MTAVLGELERSKAAVDVAFAWLRDGAVRNSRVVEGVQAKRDVRPIPKGTKR